MTTNKNKKRTFVLLFAISLMHPFIVVAGNSCSSPVDERQQFPAFISEQAEKRQALEASMEAKKICMEIAREEQRKREKKEKNVQRVVVTSDGCTTKLEIELRPGEKKYENRLRATIVQPGSRDAEKATDAYSDYYVQVQRPDGRYSRGHFGSDSD